MENNYQILNIKKTKIKQQYNVVKLSTDEHNKDSIQDTNKDSIQDTNKDSMQENDKDSIQENDKDSIQENDKESIEDSDNINHYVGLIILYHGCLYRVNLNNSNKWLQNSKSIYRYQFVTKYGMNIPIYLIDNINAEFKYKKYIRQLLKTHFSINKKCIVNIHHFININNLHLYIIIINNKKSIKNLKYSNNITREHITNNICYTFNIVQNKQVISKLSSNLIGKFCLNVNNKNLPFNKIYLENIIQKLIDLF